jgi:hypothetical protein
MTKMQIDTMDVRALSASEMASTDGGNAYVGAYLVGAALLVTENIMSNWDAFKKVVSANIAD